MSDREMQVIQKLISIFGNQQKILTKLAQAQDTLIEYLVGAARVAGMNLSPSTSVQADVSVIPGSGKDDVTETKYAAKISGLPHDNKIKTSFMNNFKAQINAQKPELNGKVDIIFI